MITRDTQRNQKPLYVALNAKTPKVLHAEIKHK